MRIPKENNSASIIFLCVRCLAASRTIRMRLQVRAVEITWRPRPLPSAAPWIIPGRSRTWILALLSFSDEVREW